MAGITAALFLPPDWPEAVRRPLRIVGILLVLIGAGVVVWAYRSLGRSFTAFTRPPPSAERVEAGPYRLVRHPMYGGGIVFFAGLSLVFGVTALVLTAALAALWRGKSAVEERWLATRFPDYDAYRRRIPRRFLPRIY
jgi:protein-S-isoprenylcysteine O-methyltransferase Ste14